MVKIGQNGQHGPKWSQMVPNDPKWSKWSQLILNVPEWSQMVLLVYILLYGAYMGMKWG